MFDGLKKKFSSFIDSISRKEKEEIAEEEKRKQGAEAEIIHEPSGSAKAGQVAARADSKEVAAKPDQYAPQTQTQVETPPVIKVPAPKHEDAQAVTESANEIASKQAQAERQSKVHAEIPKVIKAPAQKHDETRTRAAETQKPQAPGPKVTATTKIKGFIFGKARISEKDADPFIEDLRIGMLQSDVNYEVAERMAQSIRDGLVGKEVSSRGIEAEIRNAIRDAIMSVLTKGSPIDIVERARQKSAAGGLPFKIMFIGPNGAGKTTTMAKIANLLLSNGISCVMSASDTFRAAAIEQTAYHASKLGINVIKGAYGADPASVAFDAIAHAKAHGIMAVLIDSAGRQETNKSLIEELKKMVRVAVPDLKIFVGESISGNALLEQVKAINEAVGLDGIILTKLDVDSKGGNTLSILGYTTIPVLFFGTGEKYTDLMRYDPKFIVDNILPNN